jgi:pimeloyl-ACP methyl ester carboxylesterase
VTTRSVDRVSYEITGAGDAVLMIHGLGGGSNFWGPVLPAVERMTAIRPDLPGSARSGRVEGPLSIAGMVAAMTRVLDHADVERAHVFAHSMGTIVAAHLAVGHPGRVRSLALFGPLPAPPDGARAGLRARADQAERGEAAMQEIADQITMAATARDTRRLNPVAVALVREIVMRQPPDGYARSARALADAEPADLAAIDCPTLLVTGDEDAIAPPQSVRAMAGRIAGAQVQVLARCGHWTLFERPDACLDLARRFLSRRH